MVEFKLIRLYKQLVIHVLGIYRPEYWEKKNNFYGLLDSYDNF